MTNQKFQGLPVPENVIRRKRLMFLLALVIIVIIIISFTLLLWPKEKVVVEEVEDLAEFKIDKALFVTNIDEDFMYTERSNNEYNVGDNVLIYVKVADHPMYTVDNGLLVSSHFEIVTRDSNNIILEEKIVIKERTMSSLLLMC